jgi:ParB family transcriptional regulator, chromosome partitioning protein
MNQKVKPASDQKLRLGRGLAALLGEAPTTESIADFSQGVKEIPIEFLRSSTRNPRQIFDESDLDDLTSSIKERGIIQPIIVRRAPGAEDTYEIVAGERRWRAAQKAGKHAVPVIVLDVTDREALELSIVENVQRSDLNPIEEARAYAQLASEYGYNHADIGRVVGKSRSYIANTLRLLGLPEAVRDQLKAGALSAGHARALLSVADPNAVADRIIARRLTVRDVEKIAAERKLSTQRANETHLSDPTADDLVKQLSLRLGADISIKSTKKFQEFRVKFQNIEQLDYFCRKLLESTS